MLKDKTHYNIAKSMFPDLKWSTIHKVNKAIDKPRTYSRRRATAPMFPQMPQNMMYTPLTYMKAHRKWNHDWQSALQMGYMKGGIPGMFAARAHLFGDALSDMIAQRYGTAFRDVYEAHLNYHYAMMGPKWWKRYTVPNNRK